MLTTATTVSNNDSDADLKTINYDNNGGSNYSYTVANSSSFKYTIGAGNWDDTSKWNGSALPGTTADVIVRHDLTLNQAATIQSIKVCPGAMFDGGTAQTLTLEGSSTASPIFANAGDFTANTGTVHFKGESVTSNFRNGRVWGPNATTFNNVELTKNTDGDNFGVDFYDQSPTAVRATINGILTLNSATFVAHAEDGRTGTVGTDGAPFYGSTSTLKYNNTGSFNSAEEWKTGACAAAGVPYNVEIANSTTVNIAAAHTYSANSAKAACGNLVIGAGSTLQSTSNTLSVKGNWTNNNGASGFTHNSGTVRFNGDTSTTQTLVGDTTFCNVSRADATNSTFDWGNGTTTTIAGTYNVDNGTQNEGTNTTVTFTGACGAGPHEIGGGTGAKRFVNIVLASGSLQHTGSGNINVTGNWTNNGATFNGSNRTVVLNGSTAQTIGGTASTTFNNLTLNNSAGASLGIGQTVNGTLTLSNGRLTLGAYDLTMGPSAPAAAGTLSASRMIVADGSGALCKQFTADGSYDYPIGDNTSEADYSPVTSFSVGGSEYSGFAVCFRVTDADHPERPSNATTYITRYWTGTQIGSISSLSYGATFNFVSGETVGLDAMNGKKWDSGPSWAELGVVSGTSFAGTGLTGFSDFTAFKSGVLAVTLADFHAVQQADAVLVIWETASELDNRGFNLYRGRSPDGWDRRLNDALIPSQSQGSPAGFFYTWTDQANLTPGTTYYYWLEDMDLSGALTMHGPVSVDFTVPTAVTLGSVQASPGLDTLRYSTHAAAASLSWLWIVAGAGAALGASRLRRRA